MESKIKASFWTLVISCINSILAIFFSLFYNNYLIRYYGTDVNGLIATLTQFVAMFEIFEGGFTTAAIVATYTPIVNGKIAELNVIMATVRSQFRKIGLFIFLVGLALGSVYIKFIDSPISYAKTFSLLFLSVFIATSSLWYLSESVVLLHGYNREYITTLFALLSRTITFIASMIVMVNGGEILLLYTMNVINVFVNVLLCKFYTKKNFPFVECRKKQRKAVINGTKDVLFQKIAGTIFSSTDLILISTCISLAYASVYNIYYQVYKAVMLFIFSFIQAPFNSFGQLAKEEENRDRLIEYFNIYQNSMLVISTVVLTITGIMVIPFIRVYSSKITDFNYVYSSLAILFFMQIYSQVVNRPYGIILNATGNFKMQNMQCGIAAILNIIVSVSFIKWIGINSIILGSLVGTLVILFMNLYMVCVNVIKQSLMIALKNITVNCVVAVLLIELSCRIPFEPSTYIELLGMASIVTVFVAIIVVLVNVIFNYYMKSIIKICMHRLKTIIFENDM